MTNDQSENSELKSDMLHLQVVLRRWSVRLRLAESLTWGPWGAASGLGLGTALALAARLRPLLPARELVPLAALLALAGGLVGLAAVWMFRRTPAESARVFDRRFRLAERLVTAFEIDAGRVRTSPSMARAQLADTRAAVAGVDLPAALPLRASRPALLACGALAAALALSLGLPNAQEEILLRRAAVRATVEEQVEELQAAHDRLVQAEQLSEAERERLARALEEAIAALDGGRVSTEDAVAALSQAEQALAPLQDPGVAEIEGGLERVAGSMADSELTRQVAERLAQGDYQGAALALADFSTPQGEALTREEELELARELVQAAEMLAESDPDLAEQLVQAAQAIQRGDVPEAREAIWEAAQRMGEAGARVQRQEILEHTLAQLQDGRDQIAGAVGAGSPRPVGAGSPRPVEGQMPGEGASAGEGAQGENQPGGGEDGTLAAGGLGGQPAHRQDAGSGSPYDEVYVPYRLDEEGTGVDVGREGGEGAPVGGAPLPIPEGERSTVPYREVYADYAARAGAALEGSYIPLGLKRYVRDYFSSLEP